uniref:F-box domain-containing protein n=1 Tax=Ditylenchus dipsaci TaxID=166011 RepID=A0A915D4W9_9BILA
MPAPTSLDILADVLSFLKRSQLEKSMLVSQQFNSLIQQRFSEKPYRVQDDLSVFLFEQNMELRLKPDSNEDEEFLLDVDFDSDNTIRDVWNGLLGKPTTRMLNTRLFYTADSLQAVDQILEITNSISHLWSQQSLALIFNDIDSESAIYTLQTLGTSLGGTAMRFQTDWFPLVRQFEAITLCVTEGTIEMTQLAEYLHSPDTEEQSIYIFVCNNATEGSFDACETEFNEFLEVIKMKLQEDTNPCSYAITFDFLEIMEIKPFKLFNSSTKEQLKMTYEQVTNADSQQSRYSISRCQVAEIPSHLQGKNSSESGSNNQVKKRYRKGNE